MSDLKSRIADLSPEKRARLESRLLERTAAAAQASEISRRSGSGPARLSFAQQRLWFLDQLQPGGSGYNIHAAVRLRGTLDTPALQQALGEIVRRHEILRTRFETADGTPLQVVDPPGEWPLPVRSLARMPEAEREVEASRLAIEEARRPFSQSRGPLFRSVLLQISESNHVLLLTMHHIVSDGWSLGILRRELAALYEAFSAGRPSPLPELPVQYADFAEWQRDWLEGDVLRTQLDYWKGRLANLPVVELPTDRPRPVVQTDHGGRYPFQLSEALSARIRDFAQKNRATPFMALLAGFQALLHRYTGQPDIPVGSPIANRNRLETEGLIGFFVNTLIHRADFSDDPTFFDLLARVREDAMGAFAHQDLPFEKLVEELNPERTLTHTPLFQVMFAFQNVPPGDLELPGLEVTPFAGASRTAKFELTLTMFDSPEGLSGSFEYSADVFDAETVQRMARHFETLLQNAVRDPAQRVSRIGVLPPEELRRLIVDWNDTAAEYPRDACLHELFEAQAERTPDEVAYAFEGRAVTYRELDRRANRLARRLREHAVEPGTCVGIFLERSIEMVVAMFATLKAGAAYLPLDPAYPAERLTFMVGDALPRVLLTSSALAAKAPARKGMDVLKVESDTDASGEDAEGKVASGVQADDPAYIVYTSGSTGQPKGVVGLHRGAVNRLHWMWNVFPFQPGEVCCQKTSLGFLDSLWEIFGPGLAGIRTILIPDAVVRDPRRLVEMLSAHRITRLVLVPSLLSAILDLEGDLASALSRLKLWVSSGEALSADLVARFRERLPNATLLNLYGSSEASADATFFDTGEAGLDAGVPIGRPLWNVRIFILDGAMQPTPVGIPGEIYVAGDGVARGYWNRPRLTAEKFLPDTFSGVGGSKLYRTGDLGRWRADGIIEYLGRMDHQVKVRGQRVELGEVEASLRTHPDVREAAVAIRADRPGEKRIVAYFVPRAERAPSPHALRSHLAAKLPEYMIPSVFVPLEVLPLTPSGKVDRRHLPAPGEGRPQLEKEYVGPENDAERQLVRIWERALRVEPVGVTDNFFELGGHSLLAVRLFAQIEKTFGARIPLATIFRAPTVRELATVLEEENWSPLWASLIPIQTRGSRTPFYCIHAVGGNVLTYADVARHLGADQPVYGLQAQGLDGKALPHVSIEEMARHYVQEIREFQPDGPYHLGGSSFGGLVAFEVAQQLHAQGQKVGVLALFDTWGPDYLQHMPNKRDPYYRLVRFIERVDLHLGNFLAAEGARAKLDYVRTKMKRVRRRIAFIAERSARKWEKRLLPRALRKVESTSMRAKDVYVPRPYPGKVTLFRASKQPAGVPADPHLGWGPLAGGGVEVYDVPGYHGAIVYEPRAPILAAQLADALHKADPDGSSIEEEADGRAADSRAGTERASAG